MPNEDLARLTLEQAAEEVAAKRVSPVALTEAALARIERLQPTLNAYITITAEQALQAARAAEREMAAGTHRGVLHGIPIAHKDLFATKGLRTTAGSKVLADWVPDYDATIVRKLADAGAVSLGKLNMHEFAYGGTTDNPHYGAARNPWDTERTPAGSSGGTGAAVAACLAYAATGSDTGGSIRMPASFCGCVGLMPTYGRASLYGTVPLSWSLDHPGPLARTVRDAAIVMQAMSGRDPLDPSTCDVPVPDLLDGIERGPKGLRVGVPRQYFFDKLDPDVEKAVRAAISALESAGAEIREVDYARAEAYYRAATAVMLAEAAAYHKPNFPSRREDYGKDVAALLEIGAGVPATTYIEAARVMAEARHGTADAVLEGVDVLAVPTTPVVAPKIEDFRKDPGVHARFHVLTCVTDLTGQPAISVPCGFTSERMPVGVSFIGRQWDEAAVLRAARAYEMVRGEFPNPDL